MQRLVRPYSWNSTLINLPRVPFLDDIEGKRFPALGDNLLYVSILIVLISVIPIGLEILKSRRQPATD